MKEVTKVESSLGTNDGVMQLVATICDRAENELEVHGKVRHMFFVLATQGPDGVYDEPRLFLVTSDSFGGRAEKQAVSTLVKALAEASKAVGVGAVLETWMLDPEWMADPEHASEYMNWSAKNPDASLSEFGHVVEMIFVSFEHVTHGHTIRMGRIVRDADGKPSVPSWESKEPLRLDGLFANLLPTQAYGQVTEA